jgi:predicted metallopeptidase
LRRIRPISKGRASPPLSPVFGANGYHMPETVPLPLNFTQAMRHLCTDIVNRCPNLFHIDARRILFSVIQARSLRRLGLLARVTPLRFRGGHIYRRRRGRMFQVQRYWVDGVEMYYVMTFVLPRFQNQSFDEKLVTIFHELFHIGPSFDGDLRRHDGRYCLHTHSQKRYDKEMGQYAREYLANGAPAELHTFLRLNFDELREQHGEVLGWTVPTPKLLPMLP